MTTLTIMFCLYYTDKVGLPAAIITLAYNKRPEIKNYSDSL